MVSADDLIDGYLEHYGKKGMRWGSRKSGGSSKVKKKKEVKPKAKDLSDDDLKKAVNRMQMEKQYNSLSGNKTASRKGAEFAGSLALNVGKGVVTTLVTKQVGAALKGK